MFSLFESTDINWAGKATATRETLDEDPPPDFWALVTLKLNSGSQTSYLLQTAGEN